MRPRVSIVQRTDIHEGIAGALDSLDGLGDLFRNRHVAIKPNETTATSDDLTPCTQADTVEAVIRYVKRFRPRRITVTGGSGAGETGEIFALLGIDRVIRQENVEFFDHNRPPFTAVRLSYGPQEEVMVNPRVLEYDTLVSLAQHKVHDTATVTLTLKNIAMSYPAADYYGHPRLAYRHPHRFFDDIHGFITGMCQRFPIALGIVNGHPAMLEHGPTDGKAFESGLVIAGKDPVAVDSVGAKLLGFEYSEVKHIVEAHRLGLGVASLDAIEIAGMPLGEAMKAFTGRFERAYLAGHR